MAVQGIDLGKYKLGGPDNESYPVTAKKGLNERVVRAARYPKHEPGGTRTARARGESKSARASAVGSVGGAVILWGTALHIGLSR